jgi:hypothetical protein
LHSSSMIMYERMNTAHLHNEKPTPFRFILNHIKPKGCGFFFFTRHAPLFILLHFIVDLLFMIFFKKKFGPQFFF